MQLEKATRLSRAAALYAYAVVQRIGYVAAADVIYWFWVCAPE